MVIGMLAVAVKAATEVKGGADAGLAVLLQREFGLRGELSAVHSHPCQTNRKSMHSGVEDQLGRHFKDIKTVGWEFKLISYHCSRASCSSQRTL